MQSKAPVFDKIFNDYLAKVAAFDLTGKSDILGIQVDSKTIGIPFFNKYYTITPEKITDLTRKLSPARGQCYPLQISHALSRNPRQ
jgi:hypothetical protein